MASVMKSRGSLFTDFACFLPRSSKKLLFEFKVVNKGFNRQVVWKITDYLVGDELKEKKLTLNLKILDDRAQ